MSVGLRGSKSSARPGDLRQLVKLPQSTACRKPSPPAWHANPSHNDGKIMARHARKGANCSLGRNSANITCSTSPIRPNASCNSSRAPSARRCRSVSNRTADAVRGTSEAVRSISWFCAARNSPDKTGTGLSASRTAGGHAYPRFPGHLPVGETSSCELLVTGQVHRAMLQDGPAYILRKQMTCVANRHTLRNSRSRCAPLPAENSGRPVLQVMHDHHIGTFGSKYCAVVNGQKTRSGCNCRTKLAGMMDCLSCEPRQARGFRVFSPSFAATHTRRTLCESNEARSACPFSEVSKIHSQDGQAAPVAAPIPGPAISPAIIGAWQDRFRSTTTAATSSPRGHCRSVARLIHPRQPRRSTGRRERHEPSARMTRVGWLCPNGRSAVCISSPRAFK